MSKETYESYKKDVIDKRQSNRKGFSTRELRRRIGRKNMKPKTTQQREILNTMRQNKVLIESLKKQIILAEQKIQGLQEDVSLIAERLDVIDVENEPTEEEKLRARYGLETHKNALRGGKETKIYQKWRKEQEK